MDDLLEVGDGERGEPVAEEGAAPPCGGAEGGEFVIVSAGAVVAGRGVGEGVIGEEG